MKTLFIFILITFLGCKSISVNKIEREQLKSSIENNEEVSLNFDLLLHNWRNDSLGCLGYRTLQTVIYIVDSLNFNGKPIEFVLKNLGFPNRSLIGLNCQNFYYYFDTQCKDGLFDENLDFCWLELKIDFDKVSAIDINCK